MTLSEIKQNMDKFQLIQCGLRHELVRLDNKTNLPIKTGTIEEPIYKRVDLCNLNDRNLRLGCAHTSANDSFNNLIDKLPKNDLVIERLRKQLKELLVQIYLLDHRKGNFEKNFAETLEVDNSYEKSSLEIQKEIDSCKNIHHKLMNQLATIKYEIIQHIDVLIGIQTKSI